MGSSEGGGIVLVVVDTVGEVAAVGVGIGVGVGVGVDVEAPVEVEERGVFGTGEGIGPLLVEFRVLLTPMVELESVLPNPPLATPSVLELAKLS